MISLICASSDIKSADSTPKKVDVPMEKIIAMCNTLHKDISTGGFTPDRLVGLARGGLVPLGFLAGECRFNNRNTRTINMQSYNDDMQKTELHLTSEMSKRDYEDIRSILVIDDLTDGGDSLNLAVTELKKVAPNADIRTAVLFYKKRSKHIPTYHAEETSAWIVFPWEK